ncbi:MAG: Wzz/FepE/Etk N-terminal domain-containing protein [Actinomycetota bacterium]|nr:Wzz/FepE/Etk N-terminal domain-containing protein [Actinomycetota bacterium]
MTEQPLDLGRVLRALRRRWLWLVVLAGAGLAYGAVLTVVQSPVYAAKSLILLPPSQTDAQGHPLRSMETEAQIADSADILGKAGATFTPPLTARTLRPRVATRVISSDILEVSVEAGGASAATHLADAVANQYVAYSNGAAAAQTDSTVSVLQAQATDLDSRIRQLESDIDAGTAHLNALAQQSAEAARQGALLDAMRSEQVDASRQLSTVKGRIADVKLTAELSSRGTRVLQLADTPSSPLRPRPLMNLGGGGAVGLVIGVVLALAFDRNDSRLRRRDDIARAVGAPVVASLGVPKRSGVDRCKALLDLWQPNVVESLALRQAFTRLGVADEQPPANVIVVSLAGDRAGPLLALELGAFAASTETNTAVVIASADGATADLRSACKAQRAGTGRPRLSVHDLTSGIDAVDLRGAELSIAVVVADGESIPAPTWGRRTLTALAVTAGYGTPEALAAASLACALSGHPVRGIFVANPDPNDHTTGWLRVPIESNGHGPSRSLPRATGLPGQVNGSTTHVTNGVLGREVAP